MNTLSTSYNEGLVFLSILIAVFTSYTAINLVGRVTANSGRVRNVWLGGGALAMGTGIWAMHFTGMIACRLPVPVHYHIPTVVLSLATAICASAVALYIVGEEAPTTKTIVIGSVFMGISICSMHYIGMGAMRLPATQVYSKWIVCLSFVVAILLSGATLLLLSHARRHEHGWRFKGLGALVMGAAIPIVHFTGMAATSFVKADVPANLAHSVDVSTLAKAAILGTTLFILGCALLSSLLDRWLSEQHLLAATERGMLRALIDNMPDSMYIKDRDSRFVLANLGLARRFGLQSPNELVGKNDFDLFPLEIAKQFRADDEIVLEQGESIFNREEQVMESNGLMRYSLSTKVPLRDSKGEITGLAGVGRNITQRKKSELAQLEAERKYRAIFDEAIVGIFQIDPQGHFLSLNPSMAIMLGTSLGEALRPAGKTFREFMVRQERWDELIRVAQRDGSARSFEVEVLCSENKKLWLSISVREIRKEDGKIIRYEGMSEDVTERNILRDKLLRAQKLESVGQLAAGIAHEINTPAQFIGDNVRFLKDTFADLSRLLKEHEALLSHIEQGTHDAESVRRVRELTQELDAAYLVEEIPGAIEQTLEGVSRVSVLVTAMKEFSHPGKKDKTALDLNHAIQTTLTVCRNEWKYVAEVETDFDATLPPISCLPGEFNQVILNIVVNAAHAIETAKVGDSSRKGLISITTRMLNDSAEIRIKDNGCGMPESVCSRIFDPFFTTKEIGRGTGQGLAISRSVIVDKHDGSLDVETVEGVGTMFIIRLPLPQETDAAMQAAA